MDKPLLTREQVAHYLDVNPRTIDRWIKEGRLIAFRPQGTNLVRIHPNELQAFLANNPKARTRTPILSL